MQLSSEGQGWVVQASTKNFSRRPPIDLPDLERNIGWIAIIIISFDHLGAYQEIDNIPKYVFVQSGEHTLYPGKNAIYFLRAPRCLRK